MVRAVEPVTYKLFRSAVRSAVHLEMRDSFTPDDSGLARLA